MTSPLRNFDTACHIVGAVCQHFGVTLAQLESHARPDRLVWPRFVAIGLIRKHTDWGQVMIGQFVNKDHATVSYAIQSFEDRSKLDPAFRAEVDEIELDLQRDSMVQTITRWKRVKAEVAQVEAGLPLSPPAPNPGNATKTHRNSIHAQSTADAKDAGGKA